MDFSRGLANIVTLGATGREDKAIETYNALYFEYSTIILCLEKAQEYTNRILEADKSWVKYKKENKPILDSLNQNKDITEQTKEALALLETDLRLSSQSKNNFQLNLGYSTGENIAISLKTMIVPVAGTILAHLDANEKIKEIEKESDKIRCEINKMMPIFKECLLQCNELRKRNEAFRHIKEVLGKHELPNDFIPYVEEQPIEKLKMDILMSEKSAAEKQMLLLMVSMGWGDRIPSMWLAPPKNIHELQTALIQTANNIPQEIQDTVKNIANQGLVKLGNMGSILSGVASKGLGILNGEPATMSSISEILQQLKNSSILKDSKYTSSE